MAFDAHKNLAISTVATAPSPGTSGTSLIVATGDGARYGTPPFNASVYPATELPNPTNAEVVRVTAISTDTLTIVRAQEGTTARDIQVGDLISNSITVKVLTDIEAGTNFPLITTGAITGTTGAFSGLITLDSDVVLTTNAAVRRNTADSSDTGSVTLAGGGAVGATRGAHITVYGRDHATLGGSIELRTGNEGGDTGGSIDFYAGGTRQGRFLNSLTFQLLVPLTGTTGSFSGGIGATTGTFSGAITGGTYNGQTISSAANLTGTLTIASTVTLSGLTASQAVFTNASKQLVSNAITGSGNVVMSASPTLTGTITAASANFSGALTGSTYNGQTISSAANFTGSVSIVSTLSVSGGVTFASTLGVGGELDVTGGSGTGYSTAPIEVRTTATPRISFHWPAVVASQIGMNSAGTIVCLDNPGTGYAALQCAGFTCTTIAASSTVTGGTYNGQTISSAAAFTGTMTVASTVQFGYVFYPGRVDVAPPAYQGSWYLASHGSYGLYSNTGLYVAAGLYTGTVVTCGTSMTVGTTLGVSGATTIGGTLVINGSTSQTVGTTGGSYHLSTNSAGTLYMGQENSSNTIFGLGAYTSIIYSNHGYGMRILVAGGTMNFYTAGANLRMSILNSGNVSVGSTADYGAGCLAVSGSLIAGANSIIDVNGYYCTTWPTTASAANAQCSNSNYLRQVTSVLAAKHDVITITVEHARHVIERLRGVTYRSRVDEDQRLWPGLIAEEVEEVAPVLATYATDGKLQSVAYDRVAVYLLPVVQDLLRRIAKLEGHA